MVTVRSIITEALNRSNLVSRRQSAPADMVESAFRLLRGAAAQYSKDNLLQFLVSECTHDLDRREFVIGSTDPDAPEGIYLDVDMDAPLLGKVTKMYWRPKDPHNFGTWIDLKPASPDDFDMYPDTSGVYTYQPVNDLQAVVKTKLLPDQNAEVKIIYNRRWEIGLDDELRIPEEYVELFTVALTTKLAIAFPRLNETQVNRLKEELKEMENTVKVNTRAIKYVSRNYRRMVSKGMTDFISGEFITY